MTDQTEPRMRSLSELPDGHSERVLFQHENGKRSLLRCTFRGDDAWHDRVGWWPENDMPPIPEAAPAPDHAHRNTLAQIIRAVDGDHSLGAVGLAEAILASLPHHDLAVVDKDWYDRMFALEMAAERAMRKGYDLSRFDIEDILPEQG